MIPSLVLAPMAELSHRALRELIESFAVKEGGLAGVTYFTEMINAATYVSGGAFEQWYDDNGPYPEKLVYQVVGGKADDIIRAVELLDRRECLGIDINMGCSAPAITRIGAGVRWMTDIDKAGALIRGTRAKTRRRLSVKLRTGLSDDFDYLVRFCRRLEDEGIDVITLHGRTAKEKFKRRARWNYVSALKKELRIPLIGNGDIGSIEEIERRGKECDAVMIGRLALRRPWIFAEIQQAVSPGFVPAIEETGIQFLDLLSKYQPPEFHLSRARRFFHYFCDNLKWGTYVKNLINREQDLRGIARAWKEYFETPGAFTK